MKKILLFVSLMSLLLILIMLFMSCGINNQNVQTEEQSSDTIDLTVVLESKISELAPGFVNPTVIRGPGSTSNVVGSWGFHKIYKASNRAGYAFISPDNYLVLVNVTGGYVVYDVEGNNVTEAQSALAEKAKAFVASEEESYYPLINVLESKITELFPDSSDIVSIELPTFNTVVAAASFKSNGKRYYGFYSRSVGFDEMDAFIILDQNGAIAKVDAERFIFDEEYFTSFGGINQGAYKAGFEGFTSETWTGDAAVIATATMSSNAMNQSVKDAFESFACINK